MTTFIKLTAAALVLCAPVLLRANSDTDRKIEESAKASYDYRTVLQDHVKVKYALLTHKSTSALKTSVNTNDGTVVIEGEAASDAERDLVTHIAKGVHGVKEVTNKMQVKGRRRSSSSPNGGARAPPFFCAGRPGSPRRRPGPVGPRHH